MTTMQQMETIARTYDEGYAFGRAQTESLDPESVQDVAAAMFRIIDQRIAQTSETPILGGLKGVDLTDETEIRATFDAYAEYEADPTTFDV